MLLAESRRNSEKRDDDVWNRICRWWVIDPRHVTWISYWDLVTTVALVFTALVTPVEVSFLEPPEVSERLGNYLYLSNRAVDLVFITDMFLQFRVAVKVTTVMRGTFWMTSPGPVAYNCEYFCIQTSALALSQARGCRC